MKELVNKSIHEAGKLLRSGKISSQELCEAFFKQIESVESKVNSFLHLSEEKAIKQAKEIDQLFAKKQDLGPLMGIPIAPKDIYLIKNMPTTCGSAFLEGYIPPYNSTVIDKMLAQGSVFLGKVNMDEFAMGSSTENSALKQTKNPWDLSRVPGGSSGGSASVLASRCAMATLGTDTGGSIRQPASFCGIVGLKPTYGRVSRYGVIAFASSLDQVGPMTLDVEDCAILLQAIAGHDKKDSTSVDIPVQDYTAALNQSIKGLKIGIPKEYFVEGLQPEVRESLDQAIDFLKKEGCEIVDVSLPHTEFAVAAYYIIAPAEASSNLARFDGIRYGVRKDSDDLNEVYTQSKTKGFGPEVKRRIMLGTYVLSSGYYDAYYSKAQKVRTIIRKDFLDAFGKCDLLLTPTTPTTAFKIGEKVDNPVEMYLSDILTIAVNLAGLPAMSLPCGFDKNSLPIGMQIIGKPFDESGIIKLAHAYENQHEWKNKIPDWIC